MVPDFTVSSLLATELFSVVISTHTYTHTHPLPTHTHTHRKRRRSFEQPSVVRTSNAVCENVTLSVD